MKTKVMTNDDLITYDGLVKQYINDGVGQYSSLPRQLSDLSDKLEQEVSRATAKDASHEGILNSAVMLDEDSMEFDDVDDVPVAANLLSYVNCTYVDGGVATVGKVTIVNLKVTYGGSGDITITGLPKPKTVVGIGGYVPLNVYVPSLNGGGVITTDPTHGVATITFSSNVSAGIAVVISATYISE